MGENLGIPVPQTEAECRQVEARLVRCGQRGQSGAAHTVARSLHLVQQTHAEREQVAAWLTSANVREQNDANAAFGDEADV